MALQWTTRRDSTWGITHVLRSTERLKFGQGRGREILCVFFIPRESGDAEDARRRKRGEWGWRAAFEAFPPDRDCHVWLGTKLTPEQAKVTAVRVFYSHCAELRIACASAMELVQPLYSGDQ